MTPSSIILILLLVTLCLFLPRRYLPFNFIIAACLVPMNQRINIGSLDFTVLRILILAGMVRMLARGEAEAIRWNGFDKLVLAWNLSNAIIYTILWGTMSAFINRCGLMYDGLGMYWLFRHFFRSFDDIYQTIKIFAICAIISTPLVAAEKFNQSSPFSIFGPTGAAFHRDRFRCAGPFPHYIMLGCFWASLLPLFYAQLKTNINKVLCWIGILSAITCVYLSASSTPIMTIIATFLFWLIYPYRMHGKIFLYIFLSVLFILHLIMNNPVWHLLGRVNVFGGSTGWHRFHLFDEFINHWTEWLLLGIKDTSHWGGGLSDLTNQYVLEAVRGGFVTLVIFILILYKAVKITGTFSLLENNNMWLSWGLCVALLGHLVTFWGVSYFGQITMLLYLQFAIVGFIQDQYLKETV